MTIEIPGGVKLLEALYVCPPRLLPPDVLTLLPEGGADPADAVPRVVGTGIAVSHVVIDRTLKHTKHRYFDHTKLYSLNFTNIVQYINIIIFNQ